MNLAVNIFLEVFFAEFVFAHDFLIFLKARNLSHFIGIK